MGPGYFLYHGVRLFREARGARRAEQAANTVIPGTSVTPAQFVAYTAAMETSRRKTDSAVAEFGEHPFVRATVHNDPEFGAQLEARKRTHGVADWCVTCGRSNDGVVHQPTWGRYPDGRDKPKPIWFENDLMKTGLSREEANEWRVAWQAAAARAGLDENHYDFWDRSGRSWFYEQRQAGRTPAEAAVAAPARP
jgi:hypothetical protein